MSQSTFPNPIALDNSIEHSLNRSPIVAVIGGGPAGLMSAETLAAHGHEVHLFDAMPSVGRKFLLAGKGGLNLTHSEAPQEFLSRFFAASGHLRAPLQAFGPTEVRRWAGSLGIETFVGTSGRVFPVDMKAAPLLRRWLHRMKHPDAGFPVHFHTRHKWTGWDAKGACLFSTPQGMVPVPCKGVVLALGGGSWPQLGSTGEWVNVLASRQVSISALKPSNCGFDVAPGWTAHFVSRYAGKPFKSVAISLTSSACAVRAEVSQPLFSRRGEFVATDSGVEGSLIYAASALIRQEIERCGRAVIQVDLLPDASESHVLRELRLPRGSRSFASHIKSRLGLDGIKSGALFEALGPPAAHSPETVARTIKALPLTLIRPRPLSEAISTAGGVSWEGLSDGLMLAPVPGVFCAGEMLDWEAPTGGYLLTACLATGRWAAEGLNEYLSHVA